MNTETTQQRIVLLFALLFFLPIAVLSQSASSTYSAGNISTSISSYSSTCNGPLATLVVNIPAGANVTGVDISYNFTATNGAWMSEQRSQIHCQQTATTETVFSGTGGNVGGVQSYNRTGVTIANGISATGVLTFEMRAWRTWGGSACDQLYQFINNNSWTITVYYNIPGPMLYASSTTTQNNLQNIENCAGSAEILGIEVVTTGSSPAIGVTSFTLSTAGTTDISEVSAINIYYTGSSGNFNNSTLFGTVAPGGVVVVNGSQTLVTGTNYFWVEYTLIPPLTNGNTYDASCSSVTVGGVPYVPTFAALLGSRMASICNPAPGGVSSNLQAWFEAGTGTTGSPVTAWSNLGSNVNITQLTSPTGGNLVANDAKANYNSIINCNGGYNGTFHAEVPTRTALISGNEVTMFVAYQRKSAPDLSFEFHGSTQTNPASNGANQWLTWGFRHAGIGALYSNGAFYSYHAATLAQMSENSGFVGLYGTGNSAGGNSTNGTKNNFANIGAFHAGGNFMELSIGYWPGYGMSRGVMEAILWDAELSATEISKVETYLAIKYGITQGINGTSMDYISPTNGSVIWDVSANAGFNYDIAGIMRADISGLNQLKSHSTNGLSVGAYNDILTIANSTSFSSPTAISVDGSSLVWGHDNGALINTGVMVNYPTDNGELIEAIFTREWKSQERGTIGTVTLEFDLSNVVGVGGVLGANDLSYVRLLVDEDGDYSNGATSIAPSSYNNVTGIIYFQHDFIPGTGNAMDQNRGHFFTIATTDVTYAPLPVEMTSYSVSSNDCENTIQWTTVSETHCDRYEILRSYDLQSWEVIATVNGSNLSTQTINYNWVDRTFDKNGETYYQLVQYDTDGAATVLGTKGVQSQCFDNLEPVAFPNPTTGDFVIYSGRSGVYQLLDNQGRHVGEGTISEGETHVGMERLSVGSYTIRMLLNSGKEFTERIVKI